jgi:tryptophanyl-tRNA synthetase
LVPVGEDQLQHIELCRDVARAFNSRFIPSRASADYLRLPSAVLAGSSSSLHRIMSLENPTAKMSKSDVSAHAAVFLDDSDDRCARAFGCVACVPVPSHAQHLLQDQACGDGLYDGHIV